MSISRGQFLPSPDRWFWPADELPSGCTEVSPLMLAGAALIRLGQIVPSDGYASVSGHVWKFSLVIAFLTGDWWHTWGVLKESYCAATNYVLLQSGFSHTALGGTCRNMSHVFSDHEVPGSCWLLIEHTLEFLNHFWRVPLNRLDVVLVPSPCIYSCCGTLSDVIPSSLLFVLNVNKYWYLWKLTLQLSGGTWISRTDQ